MKHYEASSTIRATPEAIWEILTDGPSYASWDNGVVRVEGRIAPGETIKVVSEANPDRTFPVKVSGWRPGESMEWSGGMPLGLFRGVRTFSLRPDGAGSTDFTVREEYTGPLLGHDLAHDSRSRPILREVRGGAETARGATARSEPMTDASVGSGSKDDPWKLKTPPGTSEYEMYRDEAADPPQIVCQVGSTKLTYHLRAIEDLHAWLKEQGDWVPLGAADEQKGAAEGTVEAWGRSASNPVGGWYGLRKGYRGRFGMYMPPLLEALGLAELEHNPRNNRMRAILRP